MALAGGQKPDSEGYTPRQRAEISRGVLIAIAKGKVPDNEVKGAMQVASQVLKSADR